MKIKANLDTKRFLKDLSKIHGGLHQASSRTVNDIAEITRNRYNKFIEKDFTIRTKFTRNALKVYPSKYMSKSKPGQLRPLRDINAMLAIRNINGKPHYLAVQEFGLEKKPHKSADGTVSVASYKYSRTGGTKKGKVIPKYNLKKMVPQTLKLSGADFGVKGDGFHNKQRWAILRDHERRNDKQFNLTKPFWFRWNAQSDIYAQKKKGESPWLIRATRIKKMKVKTRANFQKAFDQINENEAQEIFNKVASRILG